MTCDEAVLELKAEAPSPEVQAHLDGCGACRDAALVLGLAALPPVSAVERAALNDLPRRVVAAARVDGRARFSSVRQLASLALAAGLGAIVASGVLLGTRVPVQAERVVVEVPLEVPALPGDFDEPNLSDDEVFFDVSWPDVSQGTQQPSTGVDP
jgi:predicted anti-sigma-YlaC factor YlaD